MSPEQSQQLQQEFSGMLSDMQDITLFMQRENQYLAVTKDDVYRTMSIMYYIMTSYNLNSKKPVSLEKAKSLTTAFLEIVKAWTGIDTTKIYK